MLFFYWNLLNCITENIIFDVGLCGWLFTYYRFFNSSFFIEFDYTFSICYKILPYYFYYYCILIRIDRLSGLLFLCPLYFFPYTLLSSYLLLLLLCLISFLLFPCASVWKTLVHEFHISCNHWMVHTSFFPIVYNYKCAFWVQCDKVEMLMR